MEKKSREMRIQGEEDCSSLYTFSYQDHMKIFIWFLSNSRDIEVLRGRMSKNKIKDKDKIKMIG